MANANLKYKDFATPMTHHLKKNLKKTKKSLNANQFVWLLRKKGKLGGRIFTAFIFGPRVD